MKNKMNKSGFISTSVLYGLFLIILIMLLMVISSYSSTRMVLDLEKVEIKKHLSDNQSNAGRLSDLIRNVSIETDLNESGLFKDVVTDSSGDELTNYYYRGEVDNWLEFAGLSWRIIRIDENGAIRIILADDPNDAADFIPSEYNLLEVDGNDNPSKVGYHYAKESAYGVTNSSKASEALMGFYEDHLMDSVKNYTDYIDYDAIYCNNRIVYDSADNQLSDFESGYINLSGEVLGTYYFYHYYTYTNGSVDVDKYKLSCNFLDESEDIDNTTISFSATSENGGNGALKNTDDTGLEVKTPISTITLDELYFAGVIDGSYSNTYLDSGKKFWTITPYAFNVMGNGSEMFIYDGDTNKVNASTINATDIYLRPVITLKSTTMAEGNGTSDDPYKVIG